MRDSIAGARNGNVLQLLLYGVKQRLGHDNVEAALEYLERLSFDLDLDHQSKWSAHASLKTTDGVDT
ncbi:MAG: hypothetical protein KF693_02365 [Nitrospira sp.]|nr:hypothetical protein [Nitrospira sp.]